MTFTIAKNLIACVALSTVCLTSAAQANDAFNKFAKKPAVATQKVAQATPYTVVTYTRTELFNKKRIIKRVVEPVTTNAAFTMKKTPTTSTDRFNKMVVEDRSISREMPVVNKRAVTIR